jgi:glycosyltransferase involved in cell wall biosynthesis
VVVDGRNGLLVDGDDPAAIADAACRILGDAGLRATLAAGALAASRDAGWERRAVAFLEALAAKGRKGLSTDYTVLLQTLLRDE